MSALYNQLIRRRRLSHIGHFAGKGKRRFSWFIQAFVVYAVVAPICGETQWACAAPSLSRHPMRIADNFESCAKLDPVTRRVREYVVVFCPTINYSGFLFKLNGDDILNRDIKRDRHLNTGANYSVIEARFTSVRISEAARYCIIAIKDRYVSVGNEPFSDCSARIREHHSNSVAKDTVRADKGVDRYIAHNHKSALYIEERLLGDLHAATSYAPQAQGRSGQDASCDCNSQGSQRYGISRQTLPNGFGFVFIGCLCLGFLGTLAVTWWRGWWR